jgi:ribosome assembly protein 1
VSTSSEGLSAVYAVLGRRRARILREEMREGSDLFSIHAYLPAEASFGFADELRRRSSGAATASLLLSHWERLQVGARGARRAAWAVLGAAAALLAQPVHTHNLTEHTKPVMWQVDPFFVPLTEEEREEFGEEGQGVGASNLAKRLIDAVRRRKGLPVEEKVVESATKQRTRARKV